MSSNSFYRDFDFLVFFFWWFGPAVKIFQYANIHSRRTAHGVAMCTLMNHHIWTFRGSWAWKNSGFRLQDPGMGLLIIYTCICVCVCMYACMYVYAYMCTYCQSQNNWRPLSWFPRFSGSKLALKTVQSWKTGVHYFEIGSTYISVRGSRAWKRILTLFLH